MTKKTKKKTKIIIIISVIVGIVILGLIVAGILYFPTSQMIVGGGAGTSVSQRINPITVDVNWADPTEQPSYESAEICIAHPPVGETWLITSFICNGYYADPYAVTGDFNQAYNWDSVPITDRLFIDNDYYLICWEGCQSFDIVGVRV